jgi:hypothetical protein
MLRVAAFLAAAAAIGATAFAAAPPTIPTVTRACSTRSFTIAFDPKRRAVVTDGAGHVLATSSYTSASVSSRCRRVAEPKGYVDAALGPEIHSAMTFRCLASKPIRIHVHAIRNRDTDAVVGSSLSVGIGAPRLRTIVAAVLKNKGDPYAPQLYRARAYCKLGARAD